MRHKALVKLDNKGWAMGWLDNILGNKSGGGVSIGGDNTGSVVIVNGVRVSGSGSAQGEVKSVGSAVDDARAIGAFDGAVFGNKFEVEWSNGPESASVTAAPNIQKLVTLKVVGSTLHIDFEKDKAPKDAVRVVISSPRLERLVVSGAAKAVIQNKGPVPMLKLNAEVSGAAEVNIGASPIYLDIDASGASRVVAHFGKTAKARASGSADLELVGTGAVDLSASGAANLRQKGGGCWNAKLSASGAANMSVRLSGVANTYESSGASHLNCVLEFGASVDGRSSGASSCKKKSLPAAATPAPQPSPVAPFEEDAKPKATQAAPPEASTPAKDPAAPAKADGEEQRAVAGTQKPATPEGDTPNDLRPKRTSGLK
jgi:hypothetical protein